MCGSSVCGYFIKSKSLWWFPLTVYESVDGYHNKKGKKRFSVDMRTLGGKGPQHILHVFQPNPRPFCILATVEMRRVERNCEL